MLKVKKEWKALYTLGPTHILNLPLVRDLKLILVDEYYAKGNWKDVIAKTLFSTSPKAIYLSPSPAAFIFQKGIMKNVRFAPPILSGDCKKEKRYILYIGRPEKIKAPHVVVELAERFPKEKFVMVGMEVKAFEKGGPERGEPSYWERVKKGLPNITYLGRVSREKLREFYCKAKLLLFPSYREGVGAPVGEALSLGIPTLISSTLPFAPILPKEWLVEPGNIPAWEKALKGMLKQLDEAHEEAERTKEEYHLQWDDYHKETVEELKAFLSL